MSNIKITASNASSKLRSKMTKDNLRFIAANSPLIVSTGIVFVLGARVAMQLHEAGVFTNSDNEE